MKLDNFVIFPRKIKSNLLEGEITLNEYLIYSWLRLSANPYGICTISINDLKNDVFKGRISENYINKIILSLKSKRYVYYSKRSGRRGSFEVHIGDFMLVSGKISCLNHLFEREKIRGSDIASSTIQSEVKPEVKADSQRLNEQKNQLYKHFSTPNSIEQVRGHNNDIENDIEMIDSRSNLNNSHKRVESNNEGKYTIPVTTYMPRNNKEEICLTIARSLGESDMRFILSIYKRYGLLPIQRAWGIIKEINEKNPNKIENKRKYFNKLVREIK